MHFVNGTDGAFLCFDKFRVAVFDLLRAFDERGELIRRLDDAFFLGGAVLAEKCGVILPKLLGKPIQQLLAGVFFDLAIAFAQCAVIVFYRRGKIARYDLGHVVIKRKQRDALGIVFSAVQPIAAQPFISPKMPSNFVLKGEFSILWILL